jgi:PAS domain
MAAKVVVESTVLAIDEAGESMRRLVEFWDAHRHGHTLPTRRDLDVVDMAPWLGRVSLFEVPENDEIRCRLYGSRHPISAGYFKDGMPVTRVQISSYVEQAGRENRLALARGDPERHRVEFKLDGVSRVIDRLRLPLAAGGGLPPMIMTFVVSDPWQNIKFFQRFDGEMRLQEGGARAS